uniref:MFS domain-containing protein n=2 Tax=Rhodnius prolixus TaxID=13249 RepID=T1HJP6_RHOPR
MNADLKQSNLELENALTEAGFGKFHLLLFLLIGIGYSCIAMEMTVISFIIPSAKCDFDMSSSDAGFLNALPSIGIVFGSFFWGALADVVGRKWVYTVSIFLAGFTSLLSSVSQYFTLFVFLRTVNGFCLAGALGLSLPYLGEFQPMKYREKVLCFMESWWTAGIIGLPCIAWLVIPLKFRYESLYFIYSSWNAFIACTATPLMMLGVWAYTFPESPKFLMEAGDAERALEVLRYMYTKNTGNHYIQYAIQSLGDKGISIIGVNNNTVNRPKKTLKSTLANFKAQVKFLFQGQHLKSTLLICFISYCLLAAYYTLMMWFPELFSRFEHFESLHPNMSTSVCEVSKVFLSEPGCTSEVNSQVFKNTLIIGLACIPTSLWLPLCVKRLGPKFFIITCVIVAAIVTAGMYFVQNSIQNLILSGIFEAFSSLAVVTLYCALVDLFPTNVRTMASGLSLCFGRMGALTGNLVFGYLIDLNCAIPIVMISACLF